MGLKTPHNREPILMVMVTNSSIFAFLDLENVGGLPLFYFWDKNFVKGDIDFKKDCCVLEETVVFLKRLLGSLRNPRRQRQRERHQTKGLMS